MLLFIYLKSSCGILRLFRKGERKMGFIKKLKLLLIVFILTVTCFSSFEVEAAPKKIKANKWYKGTVTETSTNQYTYVMPASGYCFFQITALNGRAKTVITVNNKEYQEYTVSLGDGTKQSYSYSFKKGTKINIAITGVEVGHGSKASYKCRMGFNKIKQFETENNNTKKKADSIHKGKTSVALMMPEDNDWFVFKAPAAKKYKIMMSMDNVNLKGETLAYELYKGNEPLADKDIYSVIGWQTVFNGRLKKGQKIYINVKQGSVFNYTYRIKVK